MALTLKVLTEEDEARMAVAGLSHFSGAKAKLDELFLHWLSLPDTRGLFAGLIADIRAGNTPELPAGGASLSSALLRTNSGTSLLGGNGSPSPRRAKHSPPPRSPSRSPVPPGGASPWSPSPPVAGSVASSSFSLDGSPARTNASPGRGASLPSSAGTHLRHPQEATTTSPGGGPVSPSPASTARSPAAGDELPSAVASPGSGTSATTPAASPSTPPRPPSDGAGTPRAESPSAPLPPAPDSESSDKNKLAGSGAGAGAGHIPTFFVPGAGGRGRGKKLPQEELRLKLDLIVEVFRAAKAGRPAELAHPPTALPADAPPSSVETVQDVSLQVADLDTALRVDQFPAVAKTLCGFPSFFAAPLFRRIKRLYGLGSAGPVVAAPETKVAAEGEGDGDADEEDKGEIPLRVFLRYWTEEMQPHDHVDRFFRLTKQPDAPHIVKSDLLPLMEELLAFHPGLAFLESTPEFQEKYARTVIARMFYMLDPLNRGAITARALRRSNLIEAFQHVDMEEDINLVNEYFSYEHFYVLYCKFWELDTDHDFLLSRADLDALGNHSLTKATLDRVFSQAGRPFECKEPGKMGYEDFVCFLVSEEDKTNQISIEYWFRLIDLDGDGVIRPFEMKHFYCEQMERMENMNCEVVPFEDVLCQMSDLLQPEVEGEFRLCDFLHPSRVRLTGVFFSILSNLSKFTAFEQRDPFVVKQQQEPGFTAWDRYAQIEYARLAMEEDGQDDGMDQSDDGLGGVAGWDDDDDDMGITAGAGTSNESPF